MVLYSILQHISCLSAFHMVLILKHIFSLISWFQLLYMGLVFIDPTTVYISDLVEHIIILPKRKIPPDIWWRVSHARPQDTCAQKNQIDPDSTCLIRRGVFSHVVFPQHVVFEQLPYFTWCNGWPVVLVTRAHRLSKLAFRGGVRIINPPLSNLVICLNWESIQPIFSH